MKLSNLFTLLSFFLKRVPARATEWGLLDVEPRLAPMSSEKSRAELEKVITYLRIKQGHLSIEELKPVLDITGQTRAWLHGEIDRKLVEGSIFYDATRSRYEIMI